MRKVGNLHPHLVGAIGVEFEMDLPVRILMPLFDCTLAAVVEKRRERKTSTGWFGADEIYQCFSQIVSGVSFLHSELQTAHCDIKAENIFVSIRGYETIGALALGDFGTALFVPTQEPKVLTAPRGSKGYVAPEVLSASKRKPCDPRAADVYSLGVLAAVLTDPDISPIPEQLTSGTTVRSQEDDGTAESPFGRIRGIIDSCIADPPDARITAVELASVRLQDFKSSLMAQPSKHSAETKQRSESVFTGSFAETNSAVRFLERCDMGRLIERVPVFQSMSLETLLRRSDDDIRRLCGGDEDDARRLQWALRGARVILDMSRKDNTVSGFPRQDSLP